MKIVTDKKLDPTRQYVFLHIPKCGGTYAKKVVQHVLDKQSEGDWHSPHTEYHEPYDSVLGYRTGHLLRTPECKYSKGNHPAPIKHMTVCSVRDPFKWYDSWFYFKKYFKNRKSEKRPLNENEKLPANPLESESGSYLEAIRNSLDEQYLKKISHSVLQGGFCPYVWMKEFDVGFYTAWFLYMVSDHKRIFENSEKIKNQGIGKDLDLIRRNFRTILLYDVSDSDTALRGMLSVFFDKEISFDDVVGKRERVTKYEQDYLKCEELLEQNPEIKEQFMWKERFMLNMFRRGI